MGANAMIPQPPTGFTEDVSSGQSGTIPPPPDGFTDDVKNSYWGDVGKNAWNEAKTMVKTAPQQAQSMFPLVQSVADPFSGGIPTPDTMKNAGNFIKTGGQAAWQIAKDVGS